MTTPALDHTAHTTHTSSGPVRWTSVGDGEPLVLMHGTPFSSAIWRHVAPLLAETHRVFLWDMPGYGRSITDDPAPTSLAEQARTFVELLDDWEVDEPHVVAHDIGGAVVLRAHLLHGVRLRSLTLVDAVAVQPWGTPFLRLVRENEAVFSALPAAYHEALLGTYIASASARGLRSDTTRLLVEPWLTSAGQRAFYHQMATLDQAHTEEMEGLYSTVRVPTLVCWGAEDTWLPVEHAHRLAELIPGSTLRVFAGAGHLVPEDAPEQLVHAVVRFLDGITPA